MTIDIAKLIEIRDAYDRAAYDYEGMLEEACAPVADGGGGLLERHAMLEELWKALQGKLYVQGDPGDVMAFEAATAKLRASDVPPGEGEQRR